MKHTTQITRNAHLALTSAALAVAGLLMVGATGCDDDAELEVDTQLTNVAFTQDGQNRATEGDGQMGERQTESSGELDIKKTVPEQIVMGRTMTYTLNVQNTSGGDLSGVVITEELPEGFEFVEASPEPSEVDGNKLIFRVPNMRDGQGGNIEITGTPQQVGDLSACTSYEFERGACATFTVVNPELSIQKAGPEMATVCTPVEYVYTLTNDGDTPVEDVMLYDALPEGLMFAEGGDSEMEVEIGTIEPGDSVERKVMVKAEKAGDYGSYAYARGSLEEVKSPSVETRFVAPELAINVKPTRPFEYVGKDAQFEVTITNRGEVPAERTVLATASDTGEINRVYGATENDDARDLGDGEAFIGTLQPGESRTLFVDVSAIEAGDVQFAGIAQARCADSGTELARAEGKANLEIRTISALQLEVVDKNDPVRVGDETVYEVTVINEGSADDNDIAITGELPEGMSFVSGEGASEISNDGRSITFAPVATLSAGDAVTWYVTVKADEASGGQKFSIELNSKNSEQPVTEQEPTRLY